MTDRYKDAYPLSGHGRFFVIQPLSRQQAPSFRKAGNIIIGSVVKTDNLIVFSTLSGKH